MNEIMNKTFMFTAVLALLCTVGSMSVTHATEKAPENKTDVVMEKVLKDYLQIQDKMAEDADIVAVSESARKLAKSAGKISNKKFGKEIQSAAMAVAEAPKISDARKQFKRLSEPMVLWVERNNPAGVEVVECSMAGAKWVQKKGKIRNPYYGKEMLSCGEKVS